MADAFLNPRDQADLSRLIAALKGEIGNLGDEVARIGEQVELQSAATREATEAESQLARVSGRIRGSLQGTEEIKAGTGALEDQIAAQTRLNGLIERQTALERQAAEIRGAPSIAAAESRYQSAIGAQASADVRAARARGAYSTSARTGAGDTAALLATREQATQQATAAKAETTAARRSLEAAQKAAAAREQIAVELEGLQVDLAIEQRAQAQATVAAQAAAKAEAARGGRAFGLPTVAPYQRPPAQPTAAQLAAQREALAGVPGTDLVVYRPPQPLAPPASVIAQQRQAQQAAERRAALQERIDRYQSPAFEGAPGPRPIIGGPAGSTSLNPRQLDEYRVAAAKAEAENARLATGFRRTENAEATFAAQSHQTGALTTDFVNQLVRGNVTLRQFGSEMRTTIGKFAGWAAAAALTYGALDAVKQIGTGAKDASSGAEQLRRTITGVDTTKAQSQFAELSKSADVSVNLAADAVFRFSRTFHDQNDAVAAARQGLYAYQLDQVDLNASVKAATVLHQQFGVSAKGLSGVFDVLSFAQREYNARLSDMIPLVQKAGGAIANARGSASQSQTLQDLLQQGAFFSRVTQLSGSQLGTALYRAAATFTNPSTTKGQSDLATIRQLGVGTGGGFTQILNRAIRASPDLSGIQRQQLANAIFGPQYGGRVAAGFSGSPQTQRLYEQITGGPNRLTQANDRGKTAEELRAQLGQVNKQLEQFTYGLQRLGVALAQSGAFTPLRGALDGLVKATSGMSDLVHVVGDLPGPVRDVVEGFIALRAASAFLTRTRLGQGIGSLPGVRVATNIVPGFSPSQAQLLRQGVAAAAGGESKNLAERIGGLSRQQGQIRAAGRVADTQLAAINAELATVVKGTEEEAALLERQAAAGAEVAAANKANLAIQTEINDTYTAQARAQADYRGATAGRRSTGRYSDTEVDAAASTYNVNAEEQAARSRGRGVSAYIGNAISPTRRREAKAFEEESLRQKVTAVDSAQLAEREATLAQDSRRSLGAMEALGTSTAAMGESLTAFATGMGPQIALFIALPALIDDVSGTINHLKDAAKESRKAGSAKISNSADIRDAAALAAKAAKDSELHVGVADRLLIAPGIFKDIYNTGSILGVPVGVGGGQGQRNRLAAQALKSFYTGADYAYNALLKQAHSDADALARGKITQAQFHKRMDDIRNRYLQFLGNVGQAGTAQGQAVDQAFLKATQLAERAGVADAAIIKVNANNPLRQFAHKATDAIVKQIQQYDNYVKVFADPAGGVGTEKVYYNFRKANADLQRLAVPSVAANLSDALSKFFGGSGNPMARKLQGQVDQINQQKSHAKAMQKAIDQNHSQGDLAQRAIAGFLAIATRAYMHPDDQKLTQQLATAQSAITDQFQTSITTTLTAAQSSTSITGETSGANNALAQVQRYRNYLTAQLAKVKKQFGAASRAYRGAADAAKAINQALDATRQSAVTTGLQAIQDRTTNAVASITGISPEADRQRQQKTLDGLKRQLAYAKSHRASADTIANLNGQIASTQVSLNQTAAQNAKDAADAASSIAQARVTGTSPEAAIQRASIQLQDDRRQVELDKRYGVGTKQWATDYAKMLADASSLAQDVTSNAKAIADAGFDLAGQSADPIKNVAQQIAKARYDLSFDTQHNAGAAQILQDRQTLKGLLQQQAQNLSDIQDSRYDLRSASTQDPVRQANIAVAKAKHDLAQAKLLGLGEKAINDAQATVRQTQQARAQALTDQQVQNIEFNASVGKLDPGAEAAQLQKVVDRMKRLHEPLAKIQQLETTIYGLLHPSGGSELSMNLGALKVPTAYQVRSAIKQAQRSRGRAQTREALANINQDVKVNIIVSRNADIRKVADAVGTALDANVTASARAAGII